MPERWQRRQSYCRPEALHLVSSGDLFQQARSLGRHPEPGRFPLILDPCINNVYFECVLIDGGSSIDIMFRSRLPTLKLIQADLKLYEAQFWGVLPGQSSMSLGQITFLVQFGTPDHFRIESLWCSLRTIWWRWRPFVFQVQERQGGLGWNAAGKSEISSMACTPSERAGLGSFKARGDGATEDDYIYVHLIVGKVQNTWGRST